MRGNLLRAVSHDIRTPLTAIVGGIDVILENGEQLKAAVVTLGQTTLTSLVRNSGVAALGSATATVVESSFSITKYSLFNSLATVLIVLVIVLGVILYGILGVLSDQLASLLERKLLVWRKEGRG